MTVTPQVGQTLTVSPGTWSGTPAPTFTYQWQSSPTGAVWSNIASATATAYVVAAAVEGLMLRCAVTATNAAGSVVANSTATNAVINPVIPVNSVAPTFSGTAENGSTLTIASTGTWTGSPTFTYQWQTSTTGTGGWSNLSGATASSYILQPTDVGNYLACLVTGTNAYGSGQARTAASAQIVSPIPPLATIVSNMLGPYQTSAQTTAQGGTYAVWESEFGTNAPGYWTGQGAAPFGGGSAYGNQGGNHYDRVKIWYMMWARTGIADYLQHGHDQAIGFRTDYVEANNYGILQLWWLCEGLSLHWLLTGDTASKTAVGKLADYACTDFNLLTDLSGGSSAPYMDPRNAAYTLRNVVMANYINAPSVGIAPWTPAALNTTYPTWSSRATQIVEILLACQRPSGSWGWGSSGYLDNAKPFMLGLLMDSLILYYKHINADSRIPVAVKRCLDKIWTSCWVAGSNAFQYLEVETASETTASGLGTTPSPDLNRLVVNAFGWIYNLTGDATYKTRADAAWDGNSHGYSYSAGGFSGGKQFNENYTNSFRYPYYRTAATGSLNLNAPISTVAPAITGTAMVGQVLTCGTGSWYNTVVSYAYQWQRSDTGTGGWTSIGSATASTYTPVTPADLGKYLRCVVTATNGSGSNSANSGITTAIVAASSPITFAATGNPANVADSYSTGSNTFTFTNVALGAATSGRLAVIGIMSETSGTTVAATVTMQQKTGGGASIGSAVTLTKITGVPSSHSAGTAMFYYPTNLDPTCTQADFTVTFSPGSFTVGRYGLKACTIIGANATTPILSFNTSNETDFADKTVTTSIPINGVAVCMATGSNGSAAGTWTNATQDSTDSSAAFRSYLAHRSTSGSVTIGFTETGYGSSLCVAVFQP